jgi:3-methyladenine DNA glycosylase AlkD
MDAKQILKKLESLGTAQNRKVYARHGVTGESFGVSYADQGVLTKKIKTDHALALELWESGNHDARVLATMICDPAQLDARTIDAWMKDCTNYVLTDALSGPVAAGTLAKNRMEKWIKTKDEWTSTAGWNVLCRIAENPELLSEAALAKLLRMIEATIDDAPNRTRYSMNQALITIGLRSSALQKAAIAAAERIGPVAVDHGETGCKTPEAASYILKTAAYREQKAAKKKAGAS